MKTFLARWLARPVRAVRGTTAALNRALAEALPAAFPNRLLGAPAPPRSRPAAGLLVGLVLLALLPRAVMAGRLHTLCRDGVFYVQRAAALENGDAQEAFRGFSVNAYPAVLALLHRLGLEWETAGKLWGVCMSSLLILPLFGWVRRQFDDRVAVVACILYAIHPTLIEFSPEVLRCPTYWFGLTLSVYLSWRAVTEERLLLFLAAGLAIGVTAFTRFEGWFLWLPLLGWSAARWWGRPSSRWRLAAGVLLAVALLPSLLVVANLTVLRNQPQWKVLRAAHVYFLAHLAGLPTDPATAADLPVQEAGPPSHGHLAALYGQKLAGSLTPGFALLMLGGIAAWRQTWWRRDQQPLFWVMLAVLVSVWVFLREVSAMNSRYFLTVVLLGVPFAALGFLSAAHFVSRSLASLVPGARLVPVAALLLALGAAWGWGRALSADTAERDTVRHLGAWLAGRCKTDPAQDETLPLDLLVYGLEGRRLAYYAQVRSAIDYRHLEGGPGTAEGFLAAIEERRPDVVLVSGKKTDPAIGAAVRGQAARLGLEPVESPRLPSSSPSVQVFVRRDSIRAAPLSASP